MRAGHGKINIILLVAHHYHIGRSLQFLHFDLRAMTIMRAHDPVLQQKCGSDSIGPNIVDIGSDAIRSDVTNIKSDRIESDTTGVRSNPI